jgi:hypothetical protein
MSERTRSALDRDLTQAHATGDAGWLAELYFTAARAEEADGRTDAACFFLTQAYVFALEAGSCHASDIANRLRAYHREPAE